MIRAIAKGAVFAGFGVSQPTARLYRTITRDWMGSQATHVDKLQRVWPGYVDVWRGIGVEPEGARVWVHEGGWTPFPFFANHLVTGDAGVVTNHESRMLDRYLARAVNGALDCALPKDLPDRSDALEPLRWAPTVRDAIAQIGGALHEGVQLDAIPLESESVDLCHSGGTLEHYRPDNLRSFLAEALRVLRPGGVMSHVFDHRDHLHHADVQWPYLRHYGMSDITYRALCANRLLYHSRLLPDEVADLLAEADFERITIRRMMLPSRRYLDDGGDMSEGSFGIERSKLARRFAKASDDDLRTAAAHYLYRRPG
jgi:SAM-dependent methyltransferase